MVRGQLAAIDQSIHDRHDDRRIANGAHHLEVIGLAHRPTRMFGIDRALLRTTGLTGQALRFDRFVLCSIECEPVAEIDLWRCDRDVLEIRNTLASVVSKDDVARSRVAPSQSGLEIARRLVV